MALVLTHSLLPTSNGSSRAYYPPQAASLLPHPKVGDVLCNVKCYIVTHDAVHVRASGDSSSDALGSVGSGSGANQRPREGGDYFASASSAARTDATSTGRAPGEVNNLVALQVDSLSPGSEPPQPQLKRCLEELLIRPLSGILFPHLYIGGGGGGGGGGGEGWAGGRGVRPGYYWKVDVSLQVSSSVPVGSGAPSSISGDFLTVDPEDAGSASFSSPLLCGVDAGLISLCNAALLCALKNCILPSVTFPTVSSVYTDPISKTPSFVPAATPHNALPLLSFAGDIGLAKSLLPPTFSFDALPVVVCLPLSPAPSSLFVSSSLSGGGPRGGDAVVHGFHLSAPQAAGDGGLQASAPAGIVLEALATLGERLGGEAGSEIRDLLDKVKGAERERGGAEF